MQAPGKLRRGRFRLDSLRALALGNQPQLGELVPQRLERVRELSALSMHRVRASGARRTHLALVLRPDRRWWQWHRRRRHARGVLNRSGTPRFGGEHRGSHRIAPSAQAAPLPSGRRRGVLGFVGPPAKPLERALELT